MSDDPRDWHAVASGKLARVLGASEGSKVFAEVLMELKLERISTLPQLLDVAARLETRKGFAAMVGNLLTVHASLYREG